MVLLIGYITNCFAQDLAPDALTDTLFVQILDSVIVSERSKQITTSFLADQEGIKIYAGKKTNRLTLSENINGLSFNLGRTALAKIPGLTMWEMDGAGPRAFCRLMEEQSQFPWA
jgi:Fe(3+) dicitrate transport protein